VIDGIGWIKAWDTVGGYFWNSVKITVPAVLISTFIGALNGYVLSMWRFRGSQLFFGLLLFGCFLPFQTVLLPASFTIGKLGLANTTTGLVLVHVVYGLAFTTLFFRNYYVSIPDALVKAARSGRSRLLHDFRAHPAADVGAHRHGLPDLAVHSNLERLSVWRGVRQRRRAAHYGGAQQPGQYQHRRQGIQRRHGCGHDRRAADAAGLHLCGQVFPARADVRRGQGVTHGDARITQRQHKSYGKGLPDTLKNIELRIDDGEFLILVGPSGCGKSTLMNCIAGLETISGGAILVDDADISGMSPKDRDIAMVFQSYALYPTMNVRDNIAFGLKIRKMSPGRH
jgi:hypothetical protein